MEKDEKTSWRHVGASFAARAWVQGLLVALLCWLTSPAEILAKAVLFIAALGINIAAHKAPRLQRARGAAIGALVMYLMLLAVPPVWLRVAAHNNGWIYDFEVLRPGNQPKCDVLASADAIAKDPPSFGTEAPHWDPVQERCNCSLPDHGMEGGRCRPPMGGLIHPTFTVVTALVDIGRRSRNPCNYLKMFYPHLMRDVYMVVFVEKWAVPFVERVRETYGLLNKTRIRVLTKFSQMAYYRLIPQMQAIADRNHAWHFLTGFASGVVGKTIGLYGWVNHQKYDFVLQAAEENPFGTKFFLWIDAGGGHGEVRFSQHVCACNIAVPGKVTVFHRARSEDDLFETGGSGPLAPRRLTSRLVGKAVPLKRLSLESYVQRYWLEHDFQEVMGTFWGGDLVGLRNLARDYSQMLRDMLQANRVDYDQAVLALVAATRPPYMRFIPSNFYGIGHLC